MGKKSLKNYKKQQKEIVNNKRLFKQNTIYDGNDLINNFKGDFDAALLHCLDRKLNNDIFDYIYHCQIEHDQTVKEILDKIKRRIDDCASDVAVDFQMYSENRNLDLATYISGSDISDFVMYIARKKLFPPDVFDKENKEVVEKKEKKEKKENNMKWTILGPASNPIKRQKNALYIQRWWKKYK
tara:strand:+ start:106 stop:657 length:552 start_codon:yes stop_codon:yes gene_type:complete